MRVAERGEGEEVPKRYLPFYDRLRRRIRRAIEGRSGGKLRGEVAEALLLAPDLFVLLVRLVMDPETPKPARGVLGGALAYFILPADLLPEALLGAGGFVEDLVVAAVAVSWALSEDLESRAAGYWSGSQSLRVTLRDLLASAEALLGESVHGRLTRILGRYGLDMRLERPTRSIN